MSKEDGIPKYVQLRELLLKEIAEGVLKPGDKFCTQNELMDKYGLSFATVTHALRDMTKSGYLIRKKGQGTFLSNKIESKQGVQYDAQPLYVVGPFNYRPEDQTKGHFSWFVFDDIQKGIVNSYPGAVRFVPLQEVLAMTKAKAIVMNPSPEAVESLGKAGISFVSINHERLFRFQTNSVSWEMLFGSYDLMTYFIQTLGHKRIAFIGGDMPKYFADRYAAYVIGLNAYSLPLREEYIIRGLRGYEADGYEAMKKLLSLPEPPTAVFADTDVKAFGAIRAAQDAGLNVPEDLSIAGFDDMPFSSSFAPPLTTVKIPYYEMGARAVEMLMTRCSKGVDLPAEVLKSSLAIRSSCAKCKTA